MSERLRVHPRAQPVLAAVVWTLSSTVSYKKYRVIPCTRVHYVVRNVLCGQRVKAPVHCIRRVLVPLKAHQAELREGGTCREQDS